MHAVCINIEWSSGDNGGKVVHVKGYPPGSPFSFFFDPIIILLKLIWRGLIDFMQGETVGDSTADARVDPGFEGRIRTKIMISKKNVALKQSEGRTRRLGFHPLPINTSRSVGELETPLPGFGSPRVVC